MPTSHASASRATRRAALVAGLTAALALPCADGIAVAQAPAVRSPTRTLELGLDAGAVLGLGGQSSVNVNLPAARARVGLFLNRYPRWSLEPAALLSFTDAEGTDAVLFYNLEAGALYHFRPPGDLGQFEGARGPAVAYVRPFVNLTGTASGGNDNTELSIGGGIGLKVPWRQQLAWRLEANLGYGFDSDAARIGGFAGVSFFTRRSR